MSKNTICSLVLMPLAAASALASPQAGNLAVELSPEQRLELAQALNPLDAQIPHWVASQEAEKACLDVVLYQGAERMIDLQALQEAVIGFAFRLRSNSAIQLQLSPRVSAEQGWATLALGGLSLSVPVKPATVAVLQRTSRSHPITQDRIPGKN